MNRFWVWSLGALMALSLAGCGLTGGLVTPDGQKPEGGAEASGLLSPKLPADRVLSADERQGDFDRFLAVATGEARRWSAKAVLSGAQATNVDATGGKAGGTTYVYTFTSGRNGLAVTVTGNAVSFAKAKAGAPLDARELVTGARAMSAALKAGTLASEGYVLLLGATASGPVYVIREFKREGAASVTIDARSGAPIQ
jgi:predicted small lipoprotein YifL